MIPPLVTLSLLVLYCSPLLAQDDAVTNRDPNKLILLLLTSMPTNTPTPRLKPTRSNVSDRSHFSFGTHHIASISSEEKENAGTMRGQSPGILGRPSPATTAMTTCRGCLVRVTHGLTPLDAKRSK